MDNRPLLPSNGGQGQQFPSRSGQESLYNLTFDEAHDQPGNVGEEPLNSMNIDELRNVISVEESQLMQNPPSSSSSSSFLGNFNLNGASSNKNIDEVWREIASQEHVNASDNQSAQKQLGETTLEDFLVRAGVISKGNQNGVFNHQPIMEVDPMAVVSHQTDLLQFRIADVQQQQQQHQMTLLDSNFYTSEAVYENPVVNGGYSANQLPMTVMPGSATSSESQVAAEKKCRFTDEMMKKTIERRQKRMIKNRESAARSRARKQAYTNQLEHVVFHSRKTNNWLKKQKELDILLSSDLTPMPRFQLRRTCSASF